ncbi:MAG TPA: MBL fold metallo-hydrolase [Bacillus bacterium]|nr:MBL fold metallo-hydrolase [Bacillus sp. (in: firmicutes)]
MEPLEIGNLKIYPIVLPVHHNLKSFNSYLVKDEYSLTLIDAGINNEDYWNLFIETMSSNGFTIGDLSGIYITHHHVDHVGLVNRIVAESSVSVYSHAKAIPRLKRDPTFLKGRIDFFKRLYEEMGCGKAGLEQVHKLENALIKNKHLEINADITLLEKKIHPFDVIEMPGHSPDQVAFFNEKSRTLFAGDLLINHISSNAFVEPDENGERIFSLLEQISSLRKCLTLSVDYIFSGHGTIIDQPKQLIETRLANIENKAMRILSLIQAGSLTANEIAKQFYKKTYEMQFSLVMSEIIGHIDYLEANNRIWKEKIDGVWHYSTRKE